MAKQRSEWAEKRIKEAREKSKDIEPSGFEPEEQAAELLAQCREAFPGLLQKQINISTPIMLYKAKYLIGQCDALNETLTERPKLQIAQWRRALDEIALRCFVKHGIEPDSRRCWDRLAVALKGTKSVNRKKSGKKKSQHQATILQREAIQTLASCNGNKTEAARRINISRQALDARLIGAAKKRQPNSGKPGLTISQDLQSITRRNLEQCQSCQEPIPKGTICDVCQDTMTTHCLECHKELAHESI